MTSDNSLYYSSGRSSSVLNKDDDAVFNVRVSRRSAARCQTRGVVAGNKVLIERVDGSDESETNTCLVEMQQSSPYMDQLISSHTSAIYK